jgi:hypothetical protein
MKLSGKEKQRLKTSYGPWALVTGSSSGIGLELAHLIAGAGLNVVIHGRREDKLQALATTMRAMYSVEVKIVAADLSDACALDKIIAATASLPLGLFIASAGFGTAGPFLKSSLHAELNLLQVNCSSLLMLTHHFSQLFAAEKRGGIILMSSIVAFQGTPYSANYSASKAYVQTLAEAIAVELKPLGIDVLAAAPGPVHSGFAHRANMKMSGALTTSQVGVPILRALGRRSTVLPGGLTKLLFYALSTVPRWGKIRIMSKVMQGMTAHQG